MKKDKSKKIGASITKQKRNVFSKRQATKLKDLLLNVIITNAIR